ncbi:MAG: glutamine amidotransferase [Verrucomicrobiales bacterium]
MLDFFQAPPITLASLAFANEAWGWVAVAFAVASVAVLALTYWSSPLRGRSKFLAIGLKGTGLILLALALMEPVKLDELPKKHSNDLVVLADNSAGMAVALGDAPSSPGDDMREALAGASPETPPAWMRTLGDTFRLRPFLFDRGVRQGTDFSELDFSRHHSALVDALRSVDSRFDRRPLAATIVLTDGNATDLKALEFYLSDLEADEESTVPVYPVLVGDPTADFRDLAIGRVDAATTQFEDARITLEIEARARGRFPELVEVFARNDKDEILASKTIAFPEDGEQSQAVRLRLSAVPPGISFLTVGIRDAAEDASPELTDRNNEHRIVVNQGQGPYRVLYVSGRPNWEYKFLRRAISEDAELDLVGLVRIAKREPKFEWRGRSGESSNPLFRGFNRDIPEEAQRYDEPVLIRLNTATPEELRDGFPSTEEELFPAYRAVVLDDIEAEFFTQEKLNLLEKFVSQRGGTVVMLGGQESFQQGGWNNTPVGRMLPVYLDPLGEKTPALEATYDLTREGWLEPWMRLRTGQEEENIRLAHMAAFYSINQIQAIKPGASILATVVDSEERSFPALVTQRYGEGKTAALTIGDLWRWGMKDAEQQAELAKTWRQFLRWAVAEVPSRVEMSLTELDEGALPLTRVAVRVRGESFGPQDDATVLLTVTDLDGKKTSLAAEPSLDEPGLFTAEYLSEESGGYRIDAEALDGDGNVFGTDADARALNPEADEFARLGPNPEPLRRIAEATGGELLSLSQIATLPALLQNLDHPVVEIRERPLWHAPWMFLLALACFLGEWALRRRQGVL